MEVSQIRHLDVDVVSSFDMCRPVQSLLKTQTNPDRSPVHNLFVVKTVSNIFLLISKSGITIVKGCFDIIMKHSILKNITNKIQRPGEWYQNLDVMFNV